MIGKQRWWMNSLLFSLAMLTSIGPMTFQALAQDENPGDKPADKPKETVIREQSIYIPYSKLRETFEKDGRGVFLPYEKFQELWNAAKGKENETVVPKPPRGAILAGIDSEAVVERDVMRVTAKLEIELLSKEWHSIPIRLGDAAIISAKLGDEPARVVFEANEYKLLIQHTEEQPRTVTLTVEYAKAYAKNPGQNTVSFEAPQASLNRWRVRVPQAGAKITVMPMIATSQTPPDEKAPKELTEVLAFVGAAPTVQIGWTPKAEGATGLAALVNVQSQQAIHLDEGVVRTRTELAYDISRAELTTLVLEVPADQKVVNVFDANVRQWEVKEQANIQQITVQLFQPTRGAQRLIVELERFLEDMNQKELPIANVKAVGVGRQQGIVVVRVSPSLRAEVQRRVGLTQLDARELPQQLAGATWDYSYRFATLPFDLALTTEKVQPKIRVDELVEAYLEPQQLTLDLFARYTIERAGVFQLELDIPAGFDVRQVRGLAAVGAAPAAVDAHQLQGENKTRLVVNLSQKAIGTVGLFVELVKRLEDANLLTPTGKSSELPLPLVRVAAGAGVERPNGRLIVYAPESLRLNVDPAKQEGLRTIAFAEAIQGTESRREGRFPTTREVLAFAFTDQPASLAISAERRKPYVTVRQMLIARADSGVMKYEATFFYDIRYSSVKTLRIDVPQELATQIRNETTGVREQTITPSPEGLAKEYVAWSFTGEAEFLGQPQLRLTWERKMDELEVGQPRDVVVPRLSPRDVDRASGQVVVTKAEAIEVRPTGELSGLRPIDPRHDLMPGISIPDAARAFEFQDDWSLTITATRYKLEEVKRTSIERAVIRTVVTRGQEVLVQALYRIRSARQRLALTLPDGFKLDTQPVSINGVRVSLERGDKDEFFIPLTGQSSDNPFVLELRYTTPGNERQLDLPVFLDDPAVQQVHVAVYLAKEKTLLGYRGPWTDEFRWSSVTPFHRIPEPTKTDYVLMNELVSGINVPNNPQGSFPVDGTQYVFSTLRPEQSAASSLRISAIDETWLNGLVFGVVALIGLMLTGRNASSRVTLVGLVIVGLILIGVFMPTFSHQILGGALFAAAALVGTVWVMEWLLKFIAHRKATPPASPPAESASPEPATAAATSSPFTPPTDPPANGS